MKHIKISCIILGIFFSFLMQAQVIDQVIDIVEKGQEGSKAPKNKNIADINSILEIRINKVELQKLLRKKNMAGFPKELYDKITVITKALGMRNKALKSFEESIRLYKKGDLSEYVSQLRETTKGPATLLTIPEIKDAYLKIERDKPALPREERPSNPFNYIFEATKIFLESLKKELDEKVKESGVYFQMGAWIITQVGAAVRIHLKGFDNIPEQEEYLVPRWKFVPTKKEREKFEEFKKYARENAEKVESVFRAAAEVKIKSLANFRKTSLIRELATFIDMFEEKTKELMKSNAPSTIKNAMMELKIETEAYLEWVSRLVDKYKHLKSTSQGDLTTFIIISTENDDREIVRRTGSLFNIYDTQLKLIDEEFKKLPGTPKQPVKAWLLLGELKIFEIRKLLQWEKKQWGELSRVKFDEILAGREFDAAALKFCDYVLNVISVDVQEKIEIDLAKTGYRENGDRFVVKMIAMSAKSKDKPIVVDNRVILREGDSLKILPISIIGFALGLFLLVSIFIVRKRRKREQPEKETPKRPQPEDGELHQESNKSPNGGYKIFISYRRENTADVTDRIYDELIKHFEKGGIFKDVYSLLPGVDWRKHLDRVLGECKILLAVIGKDWLNIKDKDGKRRLDKQDDPVRLEIESALERKIPVVPLLVQNASKLSKDSLPSTLKELSSLQAIEVHSAPYFHIDMDRLIKNLESLLKTMAKPVAPDE